MPGKYTAQASVVLTGSAFTLMSIRGATTLRGKLFGIVVGSRTTPIESFSVNHLKRFDTAAGTATAIAAANIAKFDELQGNAVCAPYHTHTVEPTYPAGVLPILTLPLYSKNTNQLILPAELAITIPIGATNGLGLANILCGPVFTPELSLSWEE